MTKANITGKETKKMINDIAEGMSFKLLESATKGNAKQMVNAIEISRRTSIYTLASIIFNETILEIGDKFTIKDFKNSYYPFLDTQKEEIAFEVEKILREYKAGNMEFRKPEVAK